MTHIFCETLSAAQGVLSMSWDVHESLGESLSCLLHGRKS